MSGWDGAGNFTLPYVFATDAANGIKILASRQDTQWTTVVSGLMNALCRDGQNKVIGNIDFNNNKAINLAAPAASTDAARLADIQANLNEWVAETNAFTFVSTTQFKVTGIDVTTRYTAGRRLKVTHNTGATTSYYTVTASSFSTDTTVTVLGSNLVSTITAISYSLTGSLNVSTPLGPVVMLTTNSSQNLVSGTNYNIGKAGTPFAALSIQNNMSAFDTTNGQFSVSTTPGLYLLGYAVQLAKNGATITSNGNVSWSLNGYGNPGSSPVNFPAMNADNATSLTGVVAVWVLPGNMPATQTVTVLSPTFTGGPVQLAQASFWATRVQ